ncbi:MAG TPA: hypothetical protein VMT18_03275 [Planctomycetota bacterium]|nr:hypothetical protein [Planctomycetota bacterium]
MSLGDTGQQGNGISSLGHLDFEGHHIAFNSEADNLVSLDEPFTLDVFVRNLLDGTVVRASVDMVGGTPDGMSRSPQLDQSGSRVAFESLAGDLVVGDGNGFFDVYVRDLQTATTLRISQALGGGDPDAHCFLGAISGNGERVSYRSAASNLVAGDLAGIEDVFVHDLVQGWTVRVSVGMNGAEANGASWGGSLSADGRYVAFCSEASNLVAGDVNDEIDAFLHDLQTGTTQLSSLAWDGSPADYGTTKVEISGDASTLFMASGATNLVPQAPDTHYDIFARDLATGTNTHVSVPLGGGNVDGSSNLYGVSHDGRYVAFTSYSTNLVAGDVNGAQDVFVRDLSTGTTERVNLTSLGVATSVSAYHASISGNGRVASFSTWDSTVVPFDTNSSPDEFVRERWSPVSTVASYCAPSTASVPGCDAVLSASGSPSLASAGSFVFDTGPILGSVIGVLRFGVSGPNQTPFGSFGGFDCIGPPGVRMPPKFSGGTLGTCSGSMQSTLAELAAAFPGIVLPGATVHTQVWMRDPGNSDGFALSSGVWFQVLP